MIVTENQPDGTPTWIDLGVPDLDRAMDFYGALFGWQFDVGPVEYGRYTTAYDDGGRVAALAPNPTRRRPGSGGTSTWPPATATPPRGGRAGRRNGGRPAVRRDGPGPDGHRARPGRRAVRTLAGPRHIGCERVNEPNTLVRNDLVTDQPAVARPFYAEVFGFTLDGNPDLPDFDFTFLRRPDGHEVGGIMGLPTGAGTSWSTTFEVDDTDAAVARAVAAGGTVGPVDDMIYGRFATITDPFGAEFSVIARPR